MTKTFYRLAAVAAGAVGLLASSCAYDPYYADGYGSGYYGGSSASVFISTGDPRWGYDPYCHSYYDYHRRAYYDPFLYGYYPVGYRPPIVYGVPHPHGWRPGSGHCPPPSRIRSHTLSNYRDREGAYRRGNFSWSQNVRQRDQGTSNFKAPDRTPDRGRFDGNRDMRRENDSPRTGVPNRPVGQQFPGFNQNRQIQSNPGRFERSRGNQGPDFRRIERPSGGGNREFNRPQFQNRSPQIRERSAPSAGFNNPVTLSQRQMPQQRQAPQRQAPQFDRGATRERPQFQREENRGSSMGNSSRSFGGGHSFESRGDRRRH